MPSPVKSQLLAVTPKFTAFLSICGSLGIALKVLCNPSRRKQTMHRIVMGMSMCDILASIWYFTSTWAIPAGTLSWFGDGQTETVFWAAGDSNGVSCSFAGFFNQFAVATPLYNTTLAVYFLLVVNFGWRDSRVAKIEWIFHVIPVGYALTTSIFAVAANLYGHVEWTCWILPNEFFDETVEMTPVQSRFRMIQWIFLFAIVWICIVVVTIIFAILYRKMKLLERTMRQYPYSSTFTASRAPSGSFSFSSRMFNSKELSNSDPRMFNSKELSNSDFSMKSCGSGQSPAKNATQPQECALNSENKKGYDDIYDMDSDESVEIIEFQRQGIDIVHATIDEEVDIEDVKEVVQSVEHPAQTFPHHVEDYNDNSDLENADDRKFDDKEKDEKDDLNGDNNEKIESNIDSAEKLNCNTVIENSEKLKASSNVEEVVEKENSSLIEKIPIKAGSTTFQENECVERSTNTPLPFTRRHKSKLNNRTEQKNRRIRVEVARSMKIAIQGLLYVGAFYITWTFPTVNRFTELFKGKNYFSVQFLDTMLLPLQGFFNFIIYIRPRFVSYRSHHNEEGFWKSLKVVVFEVKID